MVTGKRRVKPIFSKSPPTECLFLFPVDVLLQRTPSTKQPLTSDSQRDDWNNHSTTKDALGPPVHYIILYLCSLAPAASHWTASFFGRRARLLGGTRTTRGVARRRLPAGPGGAGRAAALAPRARPVAPPPPRLPRDDLVLPRGAGRGGEGRPRLCLAPSPPPPPAGLPQGKSPSGYDRKRPEKKGVTTFGLWTPRTTNI